MEIIKTYPENISNKEIFDLIASRNVDKMKDHADLPITPAKVILWEDVRRDSGEVQKVVSIQDQDGTIIASNSKAFIEDLDKIWKFLCDREHFVSIVARVGRTAKGREFIYCETAPES